MRFLFGMTAKDTCAHIVLWAHDRTGRPLCGPSGATVVLFTKPTAPYAGPAICQRCVDDADRILDKLTESMTEVVDATRARRRAAWATEQIGEAS